METKKDFGYCHLCGDILSPKHRVYLNHTQMFFYTISEDVALPLIYLVNDI